MSMSLSAFTRNSHSETYLPRERPLEDFSRLYKVCSQIFRQEVTFEQLQEVERLLLSEQKKDFLSYEDAAGVKAFEKALYSYNLSLVKLFLRYWPRNNKPFIIRFIQGAPKGLTPIAALLWDALHSEEGSRNTFEDKLTYIKALLELQDSRLGKINESYSYDPNEYPLWAWIKSLGLEKKLASCIAGLEGAPAEFKARPCLLV